MIKPEAKQNVTRTNVYVKSFHTRMNSKYIKKSEIYLKRGLSLKALGKS